MKRQKWFDKKFRFDLSEDHYGSVLMKLRETPENIAQLVSPLPEEVQQKELITAGQLRKILVI